MKNVRCPIQVNSIAWANNMVEAMMSDSEDEENGDNNFRAGDGEEEDDGENQITISPSKKVKFNLV